MAIADKLTPTEYGNARLVIHIANDATLTTGSIDLHADIDIFNADGERIAVDNPTPQATTPQLTAFLSWVQSNFAVYETANPTLTRKTT